MDWLFAMKMVGVLLAILALAQLPQTAYRPMIAGARREYDRKMRRAGRLMVSGVVLIIVGVAGQYVR